MQWGVVSQLKQGVSSPAYGSGDKDELIKNVRNQLPSILEFKKDK